MNSFKIINGRIWDGTGFFRGDLAIADGRIAGIGEVSSFSAEYVYDASGLTVSPGLTDIHTHMKGISTDRFGISPILGCVPFGVTAAADCGAEQGNRILLEALPIRSAVFVCTRVENNHAYFEETEKLLGNFRDKAVGVKLYFDTTISPVRDITALRETARFAREHHLRLMVHCSHSPVSMRDILRELEPGDVLTHVYHGGKNNAVEDQFLAVTEARKRGVIIDSGHAGFVHTDTEVIRSAAEKGIWPDTISTDLTKLNAFIRGGVYGMTACMSLFRMLGMPEDQIFRAVTIRAASVLDHPEWGLLRTGDPAFVTVLREGPLSYTLQNEGKEPFCLDRGYHCALTVTDGQIAWRNENEGGICRCVPC